jgi:hypothetical protein
MKLNKMELHVLTEQIHDSLEAKAQVLQKAMDEVSDKANSKQALALSKELQKLSPLAKKWINNYSRSNFDNLIDTKNILNFMRKSQTRINVPNRYNNEIFNALVIGQIDSPDVDSLIAKVTAKFQI